MASADESSAGPSPTSTSVSSSSSEQDSKKHSSANPDRPHRPTCVIVLGMAGSGKTTLMRRLNSYSRQHSLRPYILNMDPAVKDVPYEPNIDIRDTVDYKEVMKQYALGPNGGIMTSLNLFTTKIDEVMALLEKRSPDVDFIFADTPGQIEVFTWSASGSIISQTFATSFPTVLLYVIDTPRTTNCTTFMSNMLYACSILYKMKLPFVIAFNKIDVADHSFAQSWMEDFETFQEAMDQQPQSQQTFYASLVRSMSLVLEEFYANMRSVGVSAATGQGMVKLFAALGEASEEYYESYLPELQNRMEEIQVQARAAKAAASSMKSSARIDKEGRPESVSELASSAPPAPASSLPSGLPDSLAASVVLTEAEKEEFQQFKDLMEEINGKGSEEANAAIRRGLKLMAQEKSKAAAEKAAAQRDAAQRAVADENELDSSSNKQ